MAVFDHTPTDPCHPAHILVDHRGVGARLRLPNRVPEQPPSQPQQPYPQQVPRQGFAPPQPYPPTEPAPLTTMVAMETPADMDGIQGNDHSREGPNRPLLSLANDSRICLYSLTCLSPKLAIARDLGSIHGYGMQSLRRPVTMVLGMSKRRRKPSKQRNRRLCRDCLEPMAFVDWRTGI